MSLAFLGACIRLTLGAVLLLAAFGKLSSRDRLVAGLGNYRFLPSSLLRPAAVTLVVLELVLGAVLIVDLVPPAAAVAATALFAAFAVGIGVNLVRRNDSACQCFGSDQQERLSIVSLGRVVVLFVLSASLLYLAEHQPAPSSAGDVIAAFLVASATAFVLRFAGLFPQAWIYLTSDPPAGLRPTNRVSFRHQPLTASLTVSPPFRGTEHVPALVFDLGADGHSAGGSK